MEGELLVIRVGHVTSAIKVTPKRSVSKIGFSEKTWEEILVERKSMWKIVAIGYLRKKKIFYLIRTQ